MPWTGDSSPGTPGAWSTRRDNRKGVTQVETPPQAHVGAEGDFQLQ